MSAASAIDIRPIADGKTLRAWLCLGKNQTPPEDLLMVVFSGIGRKDEDVPGIEFARIGSEDGQRNTLFIADPQRTWLNRPGLVEEIVALIEATKAELGAKRVMLMGHSLGGFMAAVVPAFTPIDVALCFSPQGSVHPEVLPNDKRWWEHRQKLTGFRIRQVRDYLAVRTQYFVIFGDHPKEANQVALFDPSQQMDLFVMPQTAHGTAAKIKASGHLSRLVRFAFQNRPRMVRDILEQRLGALHLKTVAERDAALAKVSPALKA